MNDWYNDPPDDAQGLTNELIEQAFLEHDSLHELYRVTYKYTDCGPSVGALVESIEPGVAEEPVIEWQGGEPVQVGTATVDDSRPVARWVYGSDLHKFGTWRDMADKGQVIRALCVSSIVEGVDECTDTLTIENDPDEYDPGAFSEEWSRIIEKTEKQASGIWDATHGCDGCEAHWISEGQAEFSTGTPVWKECPDCDGEGVVI